ncbi:DUF6125 family protein [Chloroflexota bacterium]
MQELKDYSGEFRPGLRLQDLSKDTLIQLLTATAKLYVGIDGTWHKLMREKFNNNIAHQYESEVWTRFLPIDVRRSRKALNIWGNDVASLFKFLQVCPIFGSIFDIEFDLKNNNHGIMIVNRCLAVENAERYGDIEVMRNACALDLELGTSFEEIAWLFNRGISTKSLKQPPPKSKDEVACIWEFNLEQEA